MHTHTHTCPQKSPHIQHMQTWRETQHQYVCIHVHRHLEEEYLVYGGSKTENVVSNEYCVEIKINSGFKFLDYLRAFFIANLFFFVSNEEMSFRKPNRKILHNASFFVFFCLILSIFCNSMQCVALGFLMPVSECGVGINNFGFPVSNTNYSQLKFIH